MLTVCILLSETDPVVAAGCPSDVKEKKKTFTTFHLLDQRIT